MTTRNLNLLFIIPLLSLFLTSLSHGQTAIPVRDFLAKPFDYGYEDWKALDSVQTKTDKGVALKGSAKGGAGLYFAEAIDIASAKKLDVSLKRGDANTEDEVILKIVSLKGKDYSWPLSLKDVSATEFTTISLDLAKAQAAGVDLSEIKQLQLQGNFNPMAQVDLELATITASGTADATPAPTK